MGELPHRLELSPRRGLLIACIRQPELPHRDLTHQPGSATATALHLGPMLTHWGHPHHCHPPTPPQPLPSPTPTSSVAVIFTNSGELSRPDLAQPLLPLLGP
jgi:hypothetical protein